jgi:hypothetical protein
MDIKRAKSILELPDEYTETQLKKKYHSLAMKYHPDKNNNEDAKETFMEIQAAYELLNKQPQPFEKPLENIFSTFFKSFTVPMRPPTFKQKEITIQLSAKEYLNGTVKKVNIQEQCCCEQMLCVKCAGSGFCLDNLTSLSHCEECLGDGYYQNCSRCTNGFVKKEISISLPAKTVKFLCATIGTINIEIESPYFLKENTIYRYFDISLKESLTGFSKLFKDPFGVSHKINVHKVIQMGDGYRVGDIILLFKVNYPKKLPIEVVEQLKKINFDGVCDGRN